MEYKKQDDKAEMDVTNDFKGTMDPDLKAKTYLPFKKFHTSSRPLSQRRDPSENSLAWFMLRHGPLIPRPNPQPSTTTTSVKIANLPAAIVPLDFDLESKVYDFAMKYDNIPYTPEGYREFAYELVMTNSITTSEAHLQDFLKSRLWRDVNHAFEAAPDLPYYLYSVREIAGEDVTTLKRDGNPLDMFKNKVAVMELKTPSSLTPQDFRDLCTQQPARSSEHNQRILCQIHRFMKNAGVTWGAISNGLSTVFVRYEPKTKVFAMSDIIPHEHPAIIGYYCYWARAGDLERLDHPRRLLTLRAIRDKDSEGSGSGTSRMLTRSSARLASKTKTKAMPKVAEGPSIEIVLDWPPLRCGEFARVNTAKWLCPTGDVPIVAKLSYGKRESNNMLLTEIENYESLHDLCGSVLPKVYEMGELIEEGQESGIYCIAMESLEEVDDWNPERKEEAKQLLRQLHRRGFVHDDVAIRNFRWRPNPGEIVIIDLGMSHRGTAKQMQKELRNVDSFETSVGY